MKHGQTTNWRRCYCRPLFLFSQQLYFTTFEFTHTYTLYFKHYQTTMLMKHRTMFERLASAGKWNTVKQPTEEGVTADLCFYLLNNFIWPLLNLHIRDFVHQMLSNNYAYEVPRKVWEFGKWNTAKQPKGVIVSFYFHLLRNIIWPLLNLHIHILCTWNTIKQLCLWSTT
jgi:hypothetical protein